MNTSRSPLPLPPPTISPSVSDAFRYNGTYEPDSAAPPPANHTWEVYANGILDIPPNMPDTGLVTFNDDDSGSRMAMALPDLPSPDFNHSRDFWESTTIDNAP